MNQTTSAAPQPQWQASSVASPLPVLPPAELEAGKARASAATGIAIALFTLGIGVGITWHWGASWQQVYDFDFWSRPGRAKTAAVRAPAESGQLAAKSHALGGGASVQQLDETPLRPFADFSAGLANGGPIEQGPAAPRTDEAYSDPAQPAQPKPLAQGPRLQPVGFKGAGAAGGGGAMMGTSPQAGRPGPAAIVSVTGPALAASPVQHKPAAPKTRKGRAFGGTHLDDLPKPENPGPASEFGAGEPAAGPTLTAWGVSAIGSDPSQSVPQVEGRPHHGPEKAYEAWPEGLREKLGQKNGYGLPASGEAKCKQMTGETEKAACEQERQDKKEARATVRAATAEALGTAGRKW